MIGRREFVVGIGSAAAWPVLAQAQQTAVPVIGYLAFLLDGQRRQVAAMGVPNRQEG
jgi:hypothetical protein